MSRLISLKLHDLAAEHGVRILYACESGSRAWGFASPDSDFDVRFIYARPAREYLRLSPPRDVIEMPIVDDLDFSGWDVFKMCRLLRRSNPSILEWLNSTIVYAQLDSFVAQLRDAAGRYFSRRACGEHYLSSARSNWRAYIDAGAGGTIKKYLYVLRPLVAIRWILTRDSFPPTAFSETLAGIDLPMAVREAIAALLVEKGTSREKARQTITPLLLSFAQQTMEELTPQVTRMHSCHFPEELLDEMISHVLLSARTEP